MPWPPARGASLVGLKQLRAGVLRIAGSRLAAQQSVLRSRTVSCAKRDLKPADRGWQRRERPDKAAMLVVLQVQAEVEILVAQREVQEL